MTRRTLLAGAMATVAAAAALAADLDTLVFIREAQDAMGLPNMVLEKIQADGSGRSVIVDSSVQEAHETTGLAFPLRIPYPKMQRSPDISPAGKKIVLRRSWTLSVMNWDGSGAVNVTPYAREWYDPRWSPDGRRIVLCSDIRDLAEIFIMDADGNSLHNVTWKSRSNERSPDWSPDGRKLVFISDRNGKFELFTMGTDGLEQTCILSLDGDIREPNWGPNNRIAFALQTADGNSALFAVDPDGTRLAQLTDGRAWDGQAAWDATGKRLAFVSNRSGESDIWVLDVASGDMRNVTRNPDNHEMFPAWVPAQITDQAPDVPAANVAGLRLPRPRLLFRAEDLPAIREKFTREPFAPAWRALLAQCDALCMPDSGQAKAVETAIGAIRDNPSRGLYDKSGWIEPVFKLSFAWQVTGDRKYGGCAAKWLAGAAEEYAKWHQAMVFEYPVACAYDWLHGLLAPGELKLLNGILRTTAESFYRKINAAYFGETDALASNFATHDAGSFGPAFLALSGEPGCNADWLAAAARMTTINLNTWIGEAGDAAEGTSYFNYPVGLLMPFLVSLKINGLHPETRASNLARFADWYAVVNAGGALPAIGDSDGGSIAFPVGLLQLYPDNPTARKLWNSVKRPDRPTPDVLSLLWFEPSANQPQDYTGFPKAAYLSKQNYQIFRSGYGHDARFLTFALTAGGHAHLECGSIALRAFGQELLVDPGQAVSAADCHSQLLINGDGRFNNYRFAGAPRERIAPIQSNAFAAASSVDMVPAFANRDVGMHSGAAHGIPGPGVRLERGSRTVVMVGDDTTAVPPYYLVYDDARVGGQPSLYEQLFVGDADAVARPAGEGAFIFGKAYDGPWLSPSNGAPGEAALAFAVAQTGNHQVWVYMKNNPASERTGAFAFRIGDASRSVNLPFRYRCGHCWQWVAAGDALPLAAGKQILRILPRNTIVAKIALIPEAQAKAYRGWGALPDTAQTRACEDAVLTGDAWTLRSAPRRPAELLVATLNDEPAAFQTDTFSFLTRFWGQQYITLPRARLVKRQADANLLTLLYPHLPDMEQPRLHREKHGATLAWRGATDRVRVTRKEILVQRTHQDGRKDVLRYRRPH